MSAAAIAVVGVIAAAIVSAVAGVVMYLLRFMRASPESREQETNAFTALTSSQTTWIGKLETAVHDLEERNDRTEGRLSTTEARLSNTESELSGVKALNGWLIRRVAQLTAHIAAHDLVLPDEEPRP